MHSRRQSGAELIQYIVHSYIVPVHRRQCGAYLVVHLDIVEDVEELLAGLDLVERHRHNVALGVVGNGLW